jgi:hypothetical protein
VDVKLAFPGLAKVSRCDLVERVQEPVKVEDNRLRVKLGANAIATYRLE